MKKGLYLLSFLIFSCLFLSLFVFAAAFATIPESSLNYRGKLFSFYTSHNLSAVNSSVETAIISIHGSERNADTYFNSMVGVATKLGKVNSTLVIAPHYKLPSDKLIAGELTFTDEGWLRSDGSLVAPTILSFELMDNFINLLANPKNFPNLKMIVFTGHSAGGQLVQRFALGNMTDLKYKNIHVKYVVANPGSYAYLNAKRNFQIPVRPACAYNNYKYGLDNLNAYMKRLAVPTMQTLYINRDVTYLLGELDNVAGGIDQDCPARYQGDTRLHRGQNFKASLDADFPTNKHDLVIVPGVAHTQWGMYNSPAGMKVLFE